MRSYDARGVWRNGGREGRREGKGINGGSSQSESIGVARLRRMSNNRIGSRRQKLLLGPGGDTRPT